MAPTEVTYDLPFGFSKAAIQFVDTAQSVTFTAATDVVTLNAHGFANGDIVVFPTIVTTTGITVYTAYYVVNSTTNTFKVAATAGGSAIDLASDGTGTVTRKREVRMRMANKITSNSKTKEVDREGDDIIITSSNLQSISFTFDEECLPIGAHAAIYGITPVTAGLPDSYTNAYGLFGTSAEKTGKTVGFWGEGTTTSTDANGVQTTKTARYWYPVGVLTATKPPELTTSDKPAAFQYTFNVTNMAPTVDVAGVALPVTGSPLIYMTK